MMTIQSEAALEEALINQLVLMHYEHVQIDNELAMRRNLKLQIEIHNKITLSDAEFERVLIHLNSGDVFRRAEILRDRFVIARELPNGDIEKVWIRFLNMDDWCRNEFQVTNQVAIEGHRKTAMT